jgi:Ca2+-binding EF-hand superfamily protein
MTWKIIKESTGKVQSTDIKEINTEAGQITDEQEIANTFNNFFLNIAGNVHSHIEKGICKRYCSYDKQRIRIKL